MAVNITNLAEILQRKIYSVSSSTSVTELNNLLKAAKLADDSVIREYDSDGSLPIASSSNERLAYITSNSAIKFNTGSAWQSLLSGGDANSGGGAAVYSFQGSAYGYAAGGQTSSAVITDIDRFSLTSDGNSTDIGDANVAKGGAAGFSSVSHGYLSAGYTNTAANANTNAMGKYPFASTTTGTDVGDNTQSRRYVTGHSDETHGYTSGGYTSSQTNVIDRVTYSADGNASDVGDLTQSRYGPAGASSSTHGYAAGGSPYNVIDRFPFAASANASDVGDTISDKRGESGASSTTHGYHVGGVPGPVNNISKYSFAASANSTDVGDLTGAKSSGAGVSSTTHGYMVGAYHSPWQNVIEKFSFSYDENGTDVGDLTVSKWSSAGHQSS